MVIKRVVALVAVVLVLGMSASTALAGAPQIPPADEISDKGAQLAQFVQLVTAEYKAGVEDGKIIHQKEYDEASTYYKQAVAVFSEIKPQLQAKDTAETAEMDAALTGMGALLQQVGSAADMERLATDITTILTTHFGVSLQSGGIPQIEGLLEKIEAEAAAGEYAEAEEYRLQAYAVFETDVESRLVGRDGALAAQLEALFWEGTATQPGLAILIARKAPAMEIETIVDATKELIEKAEHILEAQMSPASTIAGAVTIILREGLEAVLVLAAVVGYLRATKAPARAQWQVLAGSALAIACSLLLWVAAQTVISITSVSRELLEGVVALLAAAVLFYVTNWLLHKVYITDWMTFVKEQVQRALGKGSLFGLAALGFMVVFREGFETVLFFQALSFDAPAWAVLTGLVTGIAILAVLTVVILRFSAQLPLKHFFTVTGILMLILAVSFVGNGLRNLQEAGLIGVTRFDLIPTGFIPSLLGLFPTLETVLGQLAALLVLGVTFGYAKWRAGMSPRKPATMG